MRILWGILGVIAIFGTSFFVFQNFSEQSSFQSTISNFEINEIKSQGITTTLTPEITTIESSSNVVSSDSFVGKAMTEELKTQSSHPSFYLNPVFAVSSTQSSVNVTKWDGSLGHVSGFDSSWNQFSAGHGSLQIAFINIEDNSKKIWTVPNDERVNQYSSVMGVNSKGDLFFGKSDANGNNRKLGKLTPSNNVFTDYDVGGKLVGQIIIDSSDNVFFNNIWKSSIHKIVPVNNTMMSWSNVGGNEDLHMDTSGNLYASPATLGVIPRAVDRLDTNTNILTKWVIPNASHTYAITSDSAGDIFFIFNDGIRSKIGRIAISDNTLTEWIIPNSNTGAINDIKVDSNGNVFFTDKGLTRFVPSTGIFTVFSEVDCRFSIEIDSSDNIYCVGSASFSKIT